MAVRCRVIVHGQVHGVGFRIFVSRAARNSGVAGWVRNRSDGTVEVVLEGELEPVEAIVRVCREGPRGASVAQIETFAEEPEGLLGFELR